MNVLFVHGMGRSRLSGWPMLRRLRRYGMKTYSFGYVTACDDFASIKSRLAVQISILSARGEYIVVGHSLGGVLLRAAINSLPREVRRPHRIFLLGSPVCASRIAGKFSKNVLFRLLTGDCGQFLSSPVRMEEIGATETDTTSIVGVRGFRITQEYFGDELNDGLVSISECSAKWITEQIRLPIIHALLPIDKRITRIITRVLGSHNTYEENQS